MGAAAQDKTGPMWPATADGDSELAASERRGRYAVDVVKELVASKLNKKSAYGTTTVKIRWQAGKVQLVTINDEVEYK